MSKLVDVNFWGGDGYLNGTALVAMASVGLLNNLVWDGDAKEEVDLHYRCMDFTKESKDKTRWENMVNNYIQFSPILFGSDNRGITCDGVTMDDVAPIKDGIETLGKKYMDRGRMALGFTADEMGKDVKRGIYGMPNVGEAFHYDARFDKLYSDGKPAIVINCGGYKGGGTAATFVSMEAIKRVNDAERYATVSGPSTEFHHIIDVPYPEELPRGYTNPVDIFKAHDLIEALQSKKKSRGANVAHIDEDIQALAAIDNQIHVGNKDYSNLSPKFYMRRFIDKIQSDEAVSGIRGIVVNMKPDCKNGNNYEYDETCPEFMPDEQNHRLHITNLLNAASIYYIATNHGNFVDGMKIYTFSAAPNNTNETKYTLGGVFDADGAIRFYAFLATGILLVKYTYPAFQNLELTHSQYILKKWAQEKRRFLSWSTPIDPNDKPIGSMNFNFGKEVASTLAEFLCSYVKPTLQAFMEIQEVSPAKVDLFPDVKPVTDAESVRSIVSDLIDSCQMTGANNYEVQNHKIDSALDAVGITNHIVQNVPRLLAVLLAGKGKLNGSNYQQTLDALNGITGKETAFLDRYQNEFREFESMNGSHRVWDEGVTEANVREKAKEYCYQIISDTYQMILNELL